MDFFINLNKIRPSFLTTIFILLAILIIHFFKYYFILFTKILSEIIAWLFSYYLFFMCYHILKFFFHFQLRFWLFYAYLVQIQINHYKYEYFEYPLLSYFQSLVHYYFRFLFFRNFQNISFFKDQDLLPHYL